MTEALKAAIKIAELNDIEQEEAIVISPEDSGHKDAIAVFRTEDDEVYALDDICTHAEASLADGWIEGTEVECPMHSGRFCLKSGKVLSMPATESTRTHKVELRGTEIWLSPGTQTEDQAHD